MAFSFGALCLTAAMVAQAGPCWLVHLDEPQRVVERLVAIRIGEVFSDVVQAEELVFSPNLEFMAGAIGDFDYANAVERKRIARLLEQDNEHLDNLVAQSWELRDELASYREALLPLARDRRPEVARALRHYCRGERDAALEELARLAGDEDRTLLVALVPLYEQAIQSHAAAAQLQQIQSKASALEREDPTQPAAMRKLAAADLTAAASLRDGLVASCNRLSTNPTTPAWVWRRLVDAQLQVHDQKAAEAAATSYVDRAAFSWSKATAYELLGKVAQSGQSPERALASYDRALDTAIRAEWRPSNWELFIANLDERLAYLHESRDELPAAVAHYARATNIRESMCAVRRCGAELFAGLSARYEKLMQWASEAEHPRVALAHAQRSVEWQEQREASIRGQSPTGLVDDKRGEQELCETLQKLVELYEETAQRAQLLDESAEAVRAYRRALQKAERNHSECGADGSEVQRLRDVLRTLE